MDLLTNGVHGDINIVEPACIRHVARPQVADRGTRVLRRFACSAPLSLYDTEMDFVHPRTALLYYSDEGRLFPLRSWETGWSRRKAFKPHPLYGRRLRTPRTCMVDVYAFHVLRMEEVRGRRYAATSTTTPESADSPESVQ